MRDIPPVILRMTLALLIAPTLLAQPLVSAAGVINFASDASWSAAAMNSDETMGPAVGLAACHPTPVLFDIGQFPGACCVWLPGWTPDTPADMQGGYFSKDLFVPGVPLSGTVWVAVDDWVQVSVNGAVVCTRGSVTDSNVAGAAQNPPLAYDLTPALVAGTNTVRVWARNGPSAFAGPCAPCPWSLNDAWVYFGGAITYDNPIPTSRASWGAIKTMYR